MRVALIHPPFRHHKFSENLKVVDEEFILAPPIILAYVAAIAEKAGHKVKLIDAHTLKLDKFEVKKELEIFKPDIIGFRLDTYTFQDALSWIKYLKRELKVPIITGGINLSLYPKEVMTYQEIDFGLIGEALYSFPQFLKAFEEKKDFSSIPGLCYRKDEKVIINKPGEKLYSFDAYPFPARHLLPNHLYHSFVSQKKNFTIMLTSTGCPFKCNFCAIAGLKHYRERSPESVIREIEECYYDYGVREIDFFDATFFVNKKRCLEIFEGIRKKRLKITWTCRSRVDLVDEELLKEAKRSGLRMIFWGIESGVKDVLNGINKEIEPEQAEKAVRLAKKYGIRNLGFLMLGSPGEREKDIKRTMEWAKELGLDYVQICRTIPKPGSELHQKLKEQGKDYWRDFILGKEKERRIYVPGRVISEERLEELLKRAYYSFYFRPKYVLHTLFKTRSLGELFRYIRVALRMLFHYFYTDVEITKRRRFIKKLAHWGKLR